MSATSRILTGLLAGALALASGFAYSDELPQAGARDSRGATLLVAARRALATGDVDKTNELVAQASELGIKYDLADDSPQRIAAAIAAYTAAKKSLATTGNSPSSQRLYGESLMDQAKWLYHWKQYEDAEHLVTAADKLRVDWAFFERPQELLGQIKNARRMVQTGPPPAARSTEPPEPAGVFDSPRLPQATPQVSVGATSTKKSQAIDLTRRAIAALRAGDFDQAERFARQADTLGVPDSAFVGGEPRPAIVLFEIQKARSSARRSPDRPPIAPQNPPLEASDRRPPNGGQINSRVVPVQASEELPAPTDSAPQRLLPTDAGRRLIAQGEAALRDRKPEEALRHFEKAYEYREQLDEQSKQVLFDRLRDLSRGRRNKPQNGSGPSPLIEGTAAAQKAAARNLSAEVSRLMAKARGLQEEDPGEAMKVLGEATELVKSSKVDAQVKTQLERRVEGAISRLNKFVDENRHRLELEANNRQVVEQVERGRQVKIDLDRKLSSLVDEYNKLIDERRFHEAELIAIRAAEIAPENSIVVQLRHNSRTLRALMNEYDIRDSKEKNFTKNLNEVDRAAIPHSGSPYSFPDLKEWRQLSDRRRGLGESGRPKSKKELEIEEQLGKPVSLDIQKQPLAEVVEHLRNLTGINIFLDQRGLNEEGVSTETPVSIRVEGISLRSALNLLLEHLNLSYVITDEVLKITSEELRDGEVSKVVYNVADLVIPIPNFVPSSKLGLASALQDGYATAQQYGAGGLAWQAPAPAFASTNGSKGTGSLNPAVLGQVGGGGYASPPSRAQSTGGGPGGLGGGAEADFDSLIELITSTVAAETWSDAGGPGAIAPFEGNLSLVISQTQQVHEEIAELLEQLRRMQDLQVTIEVRFITLNDNFFERIGIDFDFDIDDDIDRPFQVFGRQDPTVSTQFATGQLNANADYPRDVLDRDHGKSVTVGLTAPNVFSVDLDIPFRQDSFTPAIPQFGSFNPTAGASLGFAILSDIEAFFFINASQGDQRSNVLQAPKVTLFNGQQAFVSDTSQSPFVISVIPVVGDFAAGQQPVIVVLSEGTFLTVQAVVSSDRRFVRLTIVPFFSQIGDVDTFTFNGETTSIEDSSSNGPDDDTTGRADRREVTMSGTTVQLPTFSFVTVTTTVSVPDGGTVLLGGIKRLSEGRAEFGVPMLNKLPYINRLFKNVGIGRETQSLMMMVTPRIIIQEEEEQLLGVTPTP